MPVESDNEASLESAAEVHSSADERDDDRSRSPKREKKSTPETPETVQKGPGKAEADRDMRQATAAEDNTEVASAVSAP